MAAPRRKKAADKPEKQEKSTPSVLGKPEKVKREIARLNGIFSEIDENMLKILDPMIGNTAYITVVIEELQEIINQTGYAEKYENGGGQSGVKESIFVKMHKDYSKLQKDNIKTLAEYVPPAKKKSARLAALRGEVAL